MEQLLVFVLFLAFSLVQALVRAWRKRQAEEVERSAPPPPARTGDGPPAYGTSERPGEPAPWSERPPSEPAPWSAAPPSEPAPARGPLPNQEPSREPPPWVGSNESSVVGAPPLPASVSPHAHVGQHASLATVWAERAAAAAAAAAERSRPVVVATVPKAAPLLASTAAATNARLDRGLAARRKPLDGSTQPLTGSRWRAELDPRDPAGLRRAFALAVILGAPRALEPTDEPGASVATGSRRRR